VAFGTAVACPELHQPDARERLVPIARRPLLHKTWAAVSEDDDDDHALPAAVRLLFPPAIRRGNE
jgi:hypothetical protein